MCLRPNFMYTGPRLWNLCEGLFKLYTTLPPLALALAVTWVSVCRMPIVDEKAPRECDFDAMLTELKGTDQNTACVFNCQVDISPHLIRHYLRDVPQPSCVQMGKGRTTTGMIVACLVRDVLGGAVPSHKPMMADKTELPDEEEFLEEQHRWAGATDRGRYLDIFSNLSFTS